MLSDRFISIMADVTFVSIDTLPDGITSFTNIESCRTKSTRQSVNDVGRCTSKFVFDNEFGVIGSCDDVSCTDVRAELAFRSVAREGTVIGFRFGCFAGSKNAF